MQLKGALVVNAHLLRDVYVVYQCCRLLSMRVGLEIILCQVTLRFYFLGESEIDQQIKIEIPDIISGILRHSRCSMLLSNKVSQLKVLDRGR